MDQINDFRTVCRRCNNTKDTAKISALLSTRFTKIDNKERRKENRTGIKVESAMKVFIFYFEWQTLPHKCITSVTSTDQSNKT